MQSGANTRLPSSYLQGLSSSHTNLAFERSPWVTLPLHGLSPGLLLGHEGSTGTLEVAQTGRILLSQERPASPSRTGCLGHALWRRGPGICLSQTRVRHLQ